jgi:hypothetical protein
MDKIKALAQSAFDMNSSRLFFPVRHHSPACSYHLERVLEEYRPDAVLIEGPRDGNSQLPFLADEKTEAPVALYCSVKDKEGFLGEKEQTYHCYYPFLEFSPEFHALKWAARAGKDAFFIDLPYADYLPFHQNEESYGGESHLAHSRYIQTLCEEEGCRDFHELWEKFFEIGGFARESRPFMESLLGYCFFARESYSQEELERDGTRAREAAMAQEIRDKSLTHNRLLILTGGFHTPGLVKLLEEKDLNLPQPSGLSSQIYPMTYSFSSADQLSGYASGIPHPPFYQAVWEERGSGEAYSRALLHFIARTGQLNRKRRGAVTLADEIEAFRVAHNLAALRKKEACGLYELKDAVLTAFVKNEATDNISPAEEALRDLLIGDKIGSLTPKADLPPLLIDFYLNLKAFGLKKDSAIKEIALEIYRRKKHRQMSHFFHRLTFLNCGFCEQHRGPDFVHRRDLGRIREIWHYHWSPDTERCLIELNAHGGTLAEASLSLVKEKLRQNNSRTGAAAELLIGSLLMGLNGTIGQIAGELETICRRDGGFSSLAEALNHLNRILELDLAEKEESKRLIEALIALVYQRAVSLMEDVSRLPPGEEEEMVNHFKTLYLIQNRYSFCDGDLLADQLYSLIDLEGGNATLIGAACGLLYGMNRVEGSFAVNRAESYLFGTENQILEAGNYLTGLFSTARDIILTTETLIKALTTFLEKLSQEEFLRILPPLRYAFSFFTPRETDSISRKVAAHRRTVKKRESPWSPESRLIGKIEEDVTTRLTNWGIL